MVTLKERYCPTVSLLYAVQAYSPDQLMVVMHEIRDFTLDGFSLPIRPYRWNQLLAMLVMLHHLKVKRAHVPRICQCLHAGDRGLLQRPALIR